jgi:hypothetical protein
MIFVIKGQQRAQERVEARNKQLQEAAIEAQYANIKDDVEPIYETEKRLLLERQKALIRAAKKKKEDEQRILMKLEQEERLREEKRAVMKEKADRLAEITAERVEKLKVL